MIHHETLNALLMKIFNRLPLSNAFMNTLSNMVYRHPALLQDLVESMERITKRKLKDWLQEKDDELIDPQLLETKSSSKVSDNISTAWGGF